MLILLLIILLAIFCFSSYKYEKKDITGYLFMMLVSGMILLYILVFLILSIDSLVDSIYIDDKILMYQEENTNIENSLDIVVGEYYENTKDVYNTIKSESAVGNVIAIYPELNNNEVVTEQMDTYVRNNKAIKKLKLEKINAKKYKFLVYFGG